MSSYFDVSDAAKYVQEFQKTEIIYLPSGYQDGSSGHAICLKIDKNNRSLTFYNRGEGLNKYHRKAEVIQQKNSKNEIVKETRFHSALTLKNVDIKKLGSKEFYDFLYGLRKGNKVLNASDTDLVDILYQGSQAFLGGSVQETSSYASKPYLYIKPQRAGTCTFKSLTTAFYHYLLDHAQGEQESQEAVKEFKKFKSFMHCYLAVNVMNENIFECASHELLMAEEILRNIARALEKQSMPWENTVLSTINEKLKNIEPLKRDHETEIKPFSKKEMGHSVENVSTLFKNRGAQNSLNDIYIDKDFSELNKKLPENFIPNSEDWGVITEHSHEDNFELVSEILSKIPLPTRDDTCPWKEEIKKTAFINSFDALVKKIRDIHESTEHEMIKSQTLLAYYTMIAILHGIAAHEDPDLLTYGQLSVYGFDMNTSLHTFELATLDLQKRFFDLQAYFYPERTLGDIPKLLNKKYISETCSKYLFGPDLSSSGMTYKYFNKKYKQAGKANPPKYINLSHYKDLQKLPKKERIEALINSESYVLVPKSVRLLQKEVEKQENNRRYLPEDSLPTNVFADRRSKYYSNIPQGYSKHLLQDRLLINKDPYDQANRALHFLDKNFFSLTNKDRKYAYRAILAPGRLASQLKDDDAFSGRVVSFICSHLNKVNELQDMSLYLELVELAVKVEPFLREVKNYNLLKTVKEMTFSLFKEPYCSLGDKCLFIHTLFSAHKYMSDAFEDEEVHKITLFACLSYYKVPFSVKEKMIFDELRENLCRWLKNEKNLENVNTWVNALHLGFECLRETKWNLEENRIESNDGITYCLHDSKVFKRDINYTRDCLFELQSRLKSHPYFHKKKLSGSPVVKGSLVEFSLVSEESIKYTYNLDEYEFTKCVDGIKYIFEENVEKNLPTFFQGAFRWKSRDRWLIERPSGSVFLDNGTFTKIKDGKTWILYREEGKFSSYLKQIVGVDQQEIWRLEGDQDDTYDIYLHGVNLKLTYKENQLAVDQFPGVMIDKEQKSFHSIGQDYFHLRAKDNQGNQIVLLPSEDLPIVWHAFKVKGDCLESTNVESNLYLLNFYVKNQRFYQAAEQMKSMRAWSRFTQKEQAHLKSIINQACEMPNPILSALGIEALYLYIHNNYFYPPTSSEKGELFTKKEEENYKKLVISYNDNRSNEVMVRPTSNKLRYVFNYFNLDDLVKITDAFENDHSICLNALETRPPVKKPRYNLESMYERLEMTDDRYRTKDSFFLSKRDWSKCFKIFYNVIVSGTDEERKELKTKLQFHIAMDVKEVHFLLDMFPCRHFLPKADQIFRGNSRLEKLISMIRLVQVISVMSVVKLGKKAMYMKNIPFLKKRALGRSKLKERTKIVNNTFSLKDVDNEYKKRFQSILLDCFDEEKNSEDKIPLKIEGDEETKRILKKEQSFLNEYRNNKPSKFILKSGQEELLKSQLKRQKQELETQLKSMKLDLLTRSQTCINNSYLRAQIGFNNKIDFKTLQDLSLSNNVTSLSKLTGMTEDKAQLILKDTARFLLLETRREQVDHALGEFEKGNMSHVGRWLSADRYYEVSNDTIEKLWFEYSNGYHLRKNQLDKLKELMESNHPELLAEMATGFGKTKAMVPLLSYAKSLQGEKLVVNIHPQPLEIINTVDMNESMRGAYNRLVERLYFDRSQQWDANCFDTLLQDIKQCKKEGIPLNACSQTVRGLELHFISLLDLMAECENKERLRALEKTVTPLGEILRIFRKESIFTIDEAHSVLDPNQRFIYTTGVSELIDEKDLEYIEQISNCFFSQKGGALIDSVLETIPEDLREDARAFIESSSSIVPETIKEKETLRKLSLYKGLLRLIVPSAKKENINQHFGLSKLHKKEHRYAIKYGGQDVPLENKSGPSQYKNPHETLFRTYLIYRNKGLDQEEFTTLLKTLKRLLLEDLKFNKSLETSQYNTIFNQLFAGSNISLAALSDQEIEQLYLKKQTAELINTFVKYVVHPTIHYYSETIESSTQRFRTQTSNSISISATPQSAISHGVHTQLIPMGVAQGRATHLILRDGAKENSLQKISAGQPSKQIEDVLEKNRDIDCLLDPGAFGRELSNRQIADQILDRSKDDVKGVLFFSKEHGNKFVLLQKNPRVVMEQESSSIVKEHRKTYYDQTHCEGTDIKQKVDAVGLVLANAGITLPEMKQAIGRMRGLEEGQTVKFAYTEEGQLAIGDLIVKWAKNMIEAEKKTQYDSLLQQSFNAIERPVLDDLLNVGGSRSFSAKRALSLFKKGFRSILIRKVPLDPIAMYAAIRVDRTGKEELTTHIEGMQKSIKKFKSTVRAEISKEISAISGVVDTASLPEKVTSSQDIGISCQVEQEVEVEVDVDVEMETKQEFPQIERLPIDWDKKADIFKKNLIERASLVTKSLASNGIFGLFVTFSHISIIIIVILIGIALFGTILSGLAINLCTLFLMLAAIKLEVKLVHYRQVKIDHIKTISGRSTYSLSEEMARSLPKKEKKMAKFFSKDFYVTNNYFNKKPIHSQHHKQRLFDQEMKPIYSYLVIKERSFLGKESIKFMVLDQNDSNYYRGKLAKDCDTSETVAKKRRRQLAIYDPHTNDIVAQGKNKFNKDELLKKPAFIELSLQARLLAGVLNEESERAILQAKLKKCRITIEEYKKFYKKYTHRG